MQERIIEEIEAPFARYCAEMGEFGFGKEFLDLQAKLKSKQEKVDSSANLSDSTTSKTSLSNEQTMREINAHITSFNPSHDELEKVLSLGQEMFDRVSRAKPFAQFIQASECDESSEQSAPSDRAKELISLYAAVITSLSGDEEESLWDTPTCISQWRHQWLFNTGLTLPLQVCMMKHLQGVFGMEPANFTTALSKLAKSAAHKYRIIGLDDKEAQPSPASFFGFFNVPTHQSPESPLSGVYGHILRDIGERYGELLKECEGDREKLESSIEAWDSAALTL